MFPLQKNPSWRAVLGTILTVTLFAIAAPASAANWSSWRGESNGKSASTESGFATRWDKSANVRWRIPLPDRGNSTPVVWGDRIFLTQAVEKEHRRTLMCLDRKDGRILWQKDVIYSKPETTHQDNPYCAASPVTDGERVIVTHGSAGVYCYDFTGKELWKRDLGPQEHIWGNASSPVLQGDLCILYHGPGKGDFLVAMDKKTGKEVWRHSEPSMDFSDRVDGFKGQKNGVVGSFSTPIVIQYKGRDELVMSFPKYVKAFDPKTGRELWRCDGLNPLIYASLLWDGEVLVAMGGYFGNTIAVRPGGNGDVTATHRLWLNVRDKGGIGSGLIHDGHIYYQNSGNLIVCMDVKTGKILWEERVPNAGAK
ncbi:MAG TPA: PQQ-binding-like beta-propeller repeat protein, partial [Roseimicrobium sp.]|nr:PQQ-binding-like beta-propeller repeat protein [Roseimicrobium sp.]